MTKISKISLTTNTDLQNYEKRIDEITKYMNPLGIEMYAVSQNYENSRQLELPKKRGTTTFYNLLSEELAKDIGKKLKTNGISKVQYHYPWQKNLLDMNGHDIALSIKFCDIIQQFSNAEQVTINYHNVLNYPSPERIKELDGKERRRILKMLERQAAISQFIKHDIYTSIDLILENNPVAVIVSDKKIGQDLFDVTDLVAEDYINRENIDGVTFDYSHAWGVVESFKNNKNFPNIRWCEKQYDGIPKSAKSIEDFVKKVSPKALWCHISDEPKTCIHSGLHIGDGNIDFEECMSLLNKHLREETPVTIEIMDGHTPEGFKRIIEKDFPKLSAILSTI